MPNEWYRSIPAPTADRTATNVATFDTAYVASAAGAHDKITMRGGTYNMIRSLTKDGLQIVAYPGEHVIIVGGIYFTTANDCWMIGQEITDPTNTSPTFLLGNTGKNNSFINIWSHHSGNDELSSIGDFGADTGGGTLVYGCVFHNTRHVVYVQNKSTNPTKYYAHNFLSRATIDGEGQGEYLVHLYSSDDEKVRNVHFLENIFSEGQCLVGASENAVSYGTRWERNNFERAIWRGTYNNPGEITFKDNKMFKHFAGTSRMIDLDDMHGANEAFNVPPYPQINTFTGNMIYNTGGIDSINIEAKYLDSGGNLHFGDGPLRSNDNFDNNIYQGVLRNTVKANGVGLFTTVLATWRSNTNGYGCQYDTNSTAPGGAPSDYYTIYQNDYDPDRAMIFAWGAGATVPIVLPRVGAIYDVYDQWGAALFSGGTNYNVPTNTIGFTGIIKYTPAGGGAGNTTIRSFSSNSGTTGDASVSAPAGAAAGDLVVVVVHANELAANVTIADNNGSTPFTEDIQEFDTTGTNGGGSVSVFWRRIQAGDPSTYNFTISASGRWGCGAVCFQNPHPSNLWDATPTTQQQAAPTTTMPCPSITTVTANAIHLALVFTDGLDNLTTDTPAGYTKIINTSGQNVTVAWKTIAAPGATGALTFTCSSSIGGGMSLAVPMGSAVVDPGATAYGTASGSMTHHHRR